MSWIGDTFFGGAAKDASREQVASLEEAMRLEREAANEAKQTITSMFGPGYSDLMAGYEAAQDQIAQGRTSTADIYRQASQQANRLMQQGTDASISALLGRPVSTFTQSQPAPMPTPVGGSEGKPGDVTNPVQPSQPDITYPVQPQPTQPGQPQQPEQPPMQTPPGLPGGGITTPNKPGGPMQQKGLQAGRMTSAVMPNNMSAAAIGDVVGAPVRGIEGQVGSGQPSQPTTQQIEMPGAQDISAANLPQISMTGGGAIQTPDVSGIGLGGAEQAITQGAAGAEQAYMGGLSGAQDTYQNALGQQMGIIGGSQAQGRSDIMQGMGQAGGAIAQGGLQARSDIQSGLGGLLGSQAQGRGALIGGAGQARSDIQSGLQGFLGQLGGAQSSANNYIGGATQGAMGRLDPYSSAGQQALQREAAMSGALGANAQAQAYQDFSESPAQKFNRERQEQALLRNASATGGLRAGSTLTALQEQASGIAAQQEQRYLDNLRNLAGRGQQAAGQQGQFGMQGGLAQGQISSQLGQAGAQGVMNAAQQQAGIAQGLGQNLAQNYGQTGQAMMGAGQQQAGIAQNTGQNLANIYGQGYSNLANQGQQYAVMGSNAIGNMAGQLGQAQLGTGQNLAGLRAGTGQQLGNLRWGAGQQVSNQLSGLGQGMANNQLNLGQQLAGLDQSSINSIAGLLQGRGQEGFNSRMQLAQILANLTTGQGTNLAGLQSQIGAAQAGGTMGQAQGAQQGIGMLAGGLGAFFSDERLKNDIEKVADVDGIGLYSWSWKENDTLDSDLHGKRSYGVMAHEVERQYPQHVITTDSGYKAVNYTGLAQELSA